MTHKEKDAVIEQLLRKLQASGEITEDSAVDGVNHRPGFLTKTREIMKGSCGVEVIPELKEDRYLVVVVDTEHRRVLQSGSKSKKQISATKYHRLSFGKFKKGDVAPAWNDPNNDWSLTPVLDLGDGKELQIEVNAMVCDHDPKFDTSK